MKGAMYWEWRIPKEKLGALTLVKVTYEEENAN